MYVYVALFAVCVFLCAPILFTVKICQTVFSENIAKEIIPVSKRWSSFFDENSKAQAALCQVVVSICLENEDPLLEKLPTFIKALYDRDLLEEEVIQKWYDSVDVEDEQNLKAKLKLAPLITWLKESDDSDDSSE